MTVADRHRGAVAVAHQRAGVECRGLGRDGNRDRALGIDIPEVEQIQIGNLDRQSVGVGQTGAGILGGVAGDFVGGRDGLAERPEIEVAAARMTAPGADVDRNAHALVAGLFDGLDPSAAHIDIEPDILGNVHRASARAEILGAPNDRFGDRLQTV